VRLRRQAGTAGRSEIVVVGVFDVVVVVVGRR